MSNGKAYTKAFKALMVQRVKEGEDRKELCETYSIARSSLANWISQSNPDNRRADSVTAAKIRSVLEMHDTGEVHIADVIRLSGYSEQVVLDWISDPRYREATFEYDPEMTYDYYDLTDRSIVTHHLCTQTDCVSDRIDFLAALVAPTTEVTA